VNLDSQLIQDILITIGLVGGIIVYSRGRIPQQTIKNLEESNKSYTELDKARQANIDALEVKVQNVITAHREEVLQLTKTLADLQGQIKVYKELPLQQLAEGMRDVVNGNRQIVTLLTNSATRLVKDTANAASEVAHVKEDLAKK